MSDEGLSDEQVNMTLIPKYFQKHSSFSHKHAIIVLSTYLQNHNNVPGKTDINGTA